MPWVFKREEKAFDEIPAGRYRVRIDSAEKAVSNAGNDMLVIKLEVSGQNRLLWDFIPFLPDRPEITNRKLTQLFDAFGIEDGNFDLASYTGKAGAAQIKHDDDGKARLHYYLRKGSAAERELPEFKSLLGGSKPEIPTDQWMPVPEGMKDEVPFEF